MRNPLSAILQCSDEITTLLTEYKTSDEDANLSEKLHDILDASIDASQTIALCAQHQVRFIASLYGKSLILAAETYCG
jgi:hypothetical protein